MEACDHGVGGESLGQRSRIRRPMAKALEADQPRPSGWSALMGLTRDYRGKMILLGLASFAGAMLEAGFLVLLTSTV